MSQGEVLDILGTPTGTQTSELCFDYDRPEAPGWYAVYFDENGLVVSIDDESM
ncbi:outer membrane protein assembly factor BamE [Aeoliella sp. ICT_H6.2]|uniref:Outer membrane protein assembly factor BamE n=1 Tax=Aeoliella straminimaris TaxID=2954799 RepID=A0A9X2F5F4_9BACT|nr:outer membrane protein assembly factor BamE [Aeoliella straminimaris]MCO6042545.1 outer membrane protein assembly factor BamE [Aeoliella straminimaris]